MATNITLWSFQNWVYNKHIARSKHMYVFVHPVNLFFEWILILSETSRRNLKVFIVFQILFYIWSKLFKTKKGFHHIFSIWFIVANVFTTSELVKTMELPKKQPSIWFFAITPLKMKVVRESPLMSVFPVLAGDFWEHFDGRFVYWLWEDVDFTKIY